MYRQDWFMRQIEDLVCIIAKVVLKKNTPRYEIVNEVRLTTTDLLHKDLLHLLQAEDINAAENRLFQELKAENLNYLWVALDFYDRLNALDDATLERCDFSREEIESGLQEVKKIFSLSFLK